MSPLRRNLLLLAAALAVSGLVYATTGGTFLFFLAPLVFLLPGRGDRS